MNNGGIVISARRGRIWIGKYAPFFIVAIIVLSNIETMYSILAERKDFFLEHTIDETYFAVVLIVNSTIDTLLVIKGIKIITKQ